MNNCKNECPILSASLVTLTRGKYAVVDTEMLPLVDEHKWYCLGVPRYIRAARSKTTGGVKRTYLMHRVITGLKHGDERVVDHINHNSLDNRVSNMRVCKQSQNTMNVISTTGSSRFKGVSWQTKARRWASYIRVNKRRIHLGYFKDEWSAAEAYNKKALELFGEFALLNEWKELNSDDR